MVTPTPRPPPPPRGQWPALTSVTHHDDAVDGGPCIDLHLNNRPLFASSTSPQKPPVTYTRVNDFGPHMDSIFRGATYTRERLIREYIRYVINVSSSFAENQLLCNA